MENQCYVLAVNRFGDDGKGIGHSGGTAIYDFKGDTLAVAQDNQADILIYTLELEQLKQFKNQFPAHLDGDSFELSES
jgi:predicted amidohydrolase